jgi:hypothetical protein
VATIIPTSFLWKHVGSPSHLLDHNFTIFLPERWFLSPCVMITRTRTITSDAKLELEVRRDSGLGDSVLEDTGSTGR